MIRFLAYVIEYINMHAYSKLATFEISNNETAMNYGASTNFNTPEYESCLALWKLAYALIVIEFRKHYYSTKWTTRRGLLFLLVYISTQIG